ncbi:MAG: ComEC/Rec2 family competence protein [Rhodospirillales bacterium]|jgi:competence protein ComEC|nr:ComEC/Rec2 family competence protein [Rhodospirillales bacterium]
MSESSLLGAASPSPGGLAGVAARLAAALAAERERWVLWLPVAVGLGIAAYFTLPVEPPWWPAVGVLVVIAVALVAAPSRSALRLLTVGVAAVACGFVAAQVRTLVVEAPVLEKRIGPLTVEGRIVEVETLGRGRRILLDDLDIAGLVAEDRPRRARIRVADEPSLAPGNRIRIRAVLAPPPAPALPGAFDFQRQSYFRGLGAVGFAMGRPQVVAADAEGSVGLALAALRQRIGGRIAAGLEGASGAMARALMTGERGAIPEDVLAAMRDSGLAHLLAISGLHIGLVAGILFVGLRAALALVPPVALRYPIKKWAAAAALPGAAAYALISGATVPTQRAFLMLGLVLLAVLLDRRGLSIRTVAWAALAILLVQPESLLGASFQLSFAAVVALIAVYEKIAERRHRDDRRPHGWPWRILLYVGGVALSSLIAGAATTPFALYHFNRLAAFGVAANLAAVPLTALWIMPWAVVAFALMPFGLEALALAPMGWGVEGIIIVAREVAAWPGAVTLLPAMPTAGLLAVAIGGLWLALWRGRWRYWGVVGVVVGLASGAWVSPPDVLVDGSGRLMAVRDADGALAVSSRRLSRFDAEIWLRRGGQEETPDLWPAAGVAGDGTLACDALGCIYRAAGHVIALVRDEGALAEDCRLADVVVASVPVRRPCPSAAVVIDRFDLWRNGAHALWVATDGIRVESVNAVRGDRPWVARPRTQSRRRPGNEQGRP